jgi:hypothetical protein
MHHHKAAKKTSPSKSEKVPLVRAVVLHQDDKLSTVGFPALHQAETKRVTFARPLYAKCMAIDGVWATDCLVLSVWDTGAQLRVRRPDGILSAVYLVLQTSLQAMQKGLGMGQCDSSRISTEAARLLVKAELIASATIETSPSTNVVVLSRCGAE